MDDAVTPVDRWLPVVGYEGHYEVSDLGRVRSLERVVPHARHGQYKLPARLLTPTLHNYPAALHVSVSLTLATVKRTHLVHVLVAAAFLGPRPAGLDVLHGPGGQADNRAINLSYGTPSQNGLDQRRDGTSHQVNKTHCPRRHLLNAPNLVPSQLKKGKRSCLACARGRTSVSNGKRDGITRDFPTEADSYYFTIMRTHNG